MPEFKGAFQWLEGGKPDERLSEGKKGQMGIRFREKADR